MQIQLFIIPDNLSLFQSHTYRITKISLNILFSEQFINNKKKMSFILN